MKYQFFSLIGLIGSCISYAYGGWSESLTTLLVFMAIDYITGFMVAGVFNKSGKSNNGALNSSVGWKGLCKKGVTLLIVLVASRLDLIMGSSFIKDAVIIAFIANECVSIVENAGLMGIPIPKVIINAIEVLKQKAEDNVDENEETE